MSEGAPLTTTAQSAPPRCKQAVSQSRSQSLSRKESPVDARGWGKKYRVAGLSTQVPPGVPSCPAQPNWASSGAGCKPLTKSRSGSAKEARTATRQRPKAFIHLSCVICSSYTCESSYEYIVYYERRLDHMFSFNEYFFSIF